jgi:hypothetical protein
MRSPGICARLPLRQSRDACTHDAIRLSVTRYRTANRGVAFALAMKQMAEHSMTVAEERKEAERVDDMSGGSLHLQPHEKWDMRRDVTVPGTVAAEGARRAGRAAEADRPVLDLVPSGVPVPGFTISSRGGVAVACVWIGRVGH